MTKCLFFTGTGTGVGKTHVAALVAGELRQQGQRVGVYKPVASGCRREGAHLVSDDAVALWEAAGRPGELDEVAPQRFAAPLAPHLAARAEGQQIDETLLRTAFERWCDHSDIVLIEGAGGLMSPISDELYNADLVLDFGCPLVVVAANRLGVINHTLQTLITAATFRDGLEVAGIVLNNVAPANPDDDPSLLTNAAELAARCVPPVLVEVPHHGEFSRPVDWSALATSMPDAGGA